MRKSFIKRLLFVALLFVLGTGLESCSNMRWGTSAGLDVRFGPGGPRVVPRFEVNMYSGGRF